MAALADQLAGKRARTRRRIYETAMRLFAEQGFEAVGVHQIAAAAGVTPPTFYHHFAGKEEIVLPVPAVEEFLPFFAVELGDMPLGQRIRTLAPQWLAQFPDAARAELLERWQVVACTPGLRTRAAEYERTTAETMIEAFSVATGCTPTPAERVVATAYLTAFTATFLTWADGYGSRPLEEVAAEAFAPLASL